jgi:hypothetical protein
MKRMKKILINILTVNKMKTGIFLIKSFCVILLAGMICGCTRYPEKEVTNPPFVNKTALNMYVGDEEQITASPSDATFQWSSDNEEVVRVSQSGVVTALREGLATISVASENDKINIDVRVRTFIPMTDITLPVQSLQLAPGGKAQLWAYPVPEDASESVTWASTNPAVATVNQAGMVTALAKGITTVTVGAGDVTKNINVRIPELYQCDKTGWTISSYNSETWDQRAASAIDGKDETVWCPLWSSAQLPHWIVIDMKAPIEVVKIITLRYSSISVAKTLQYFIGDDPDPNATTWVKIMQGTYESVTADHKLQLDAANPRTGQYLKLLLEDSFDPPHILIAEIDVYGFQY